MGEFCTEKLRSLSGTDLQILVELVGKSIAQILGEGSAAELSGEGGLRAQVFTEETAAELIVFEPRVNPVMGSLTPLKIMVDGRHGSLVLGIMPLGTPVKRFSNVVFADGEPDINPVGSV